MSLEASALRALDLLAPRRLVAILHCDDPVFLGSSRGAINLTMQVLSRWCFEHKAEFHVGDNKTVAMVLGGGLHSGSDMAGQVADVLLPCAGGPVTQALTFKVWHRWLGIPFDARLCFRRVLQERLRLASGEFAALPGLLESRVAPLHFALELFEAKVDSVVAFARWLFCMVPDAKDLLDAQYETWAKQLLGVPSWKNGAVARCELGWGLSGYARALLAVAMRRAALWRLPDDDLYKSVFVAGHGVTTSSWAKCSLDSSQAVGIVDWPSCATAQQTKSAYKKCVSDVLQQVCYSEWQGAVARHGALVPYGWEQFAGNHIQAVRRLSLSWSDQLCVWSWCRLRAGWIMLSGVRGLPSRARCQNCLFCDSRVSKPMVHCLSCCSHWCTFRDAFVHATGGLVETAGRLAVAVLATKPRDVSFCVVLRWADAMDRESHRLQRTARD
ncbi:unnamed protein product [Polarella glacialis]|uniref:Reverse transcriptase domain-containing protein n=1 Tax=Polarella glacialis TaxID=89957 RepID=A0A813GAF1_POLGL|nr:unnamed protein product [Polarella glacialis]